LTDCTACYPPYSINLAETTCEYNETLDLLMQKKYTPPVKWYVTASYYAGAVLAIVMSYFLYKCLRAAFLKYEAGKDRSYNVFDKAELSMGERRQINHWEFVIPETKKTIILQNIKAIKKEGDDHEIIVEFDKSINKDLENAQKRIQMVKSNQSIPFCTKFRYFEVDVLDNPNDCNIYFGLIEEKDPFTDQLDTID
jgi:hypothetical protein